MHSDKGQIWAGEVNCGIPSHKLMERVKILHFNCSPHPMSPQATLRLTSSFFSQNLHTHSIFHPLFNSAPTYPLSFIFRDDPFLSPSPQNMFFPGRDHLAVLKELWRSTTLPLPRSNSAFSNPAACIFIFSMFKQLEYKPLS